MSVDRQKYYMDQVKQQQEYHSRKARTFKQRYQLIQALVVIGALSVPVLLSLNLPPLVPTLISLLVAIATGLENVYKNGENWVAFRRTSEMLKREQRMYLARASVYSANNAFDLFVERIEGALGEQNEIFSQIARANPQSQSSPTSQIPPTSG